MPCTSAAPAAARKHERAVSDKRQMAVEKTVEAGSAGGAAPVRVLTLNHGEHNDSTLHRLNKGCVLRFQPGPSLFGRKVFLYTNYVITDNESGADSAEFVRSQYYTLEWFRETGAGAGAGAGAREAAGAGALVDGSDLLAEVTLARAGAFHYYFVYDTAECPLGPQGSGWFQVAPSLSAGGVPIPLDALCCQTVLAKCLGPLPRWENTLRVAHEAGYNMIHFTPIQELGGSGSSYSLAHQLRLDPRYSAPAGSASFADVEALLTKMRNEWKMLSICDVVLNHTANESSWLSSHPDCAYNARACPHLRPAALLDVALAKLTADIEGGKSLAREVTEEYHLDAIRGELERRAASLRLHECYQCDVDATVAQFAETARNRVPAPAAPDGVDARSLRLRADPERRRHRAGVDMDLALQIYNLHRSDISAEEARIAACAASLRAKLTDLNKAEEDKMREDLRAAVDNCLAGIRYFRLQPDGPKIKEITEKNPLVSRYFTYPVSLDLARASAADLEASVWGAAGDRVMAHNGWLMDADPLEDFASREANGTVYLRRELIAWGDSVKLRYGAKPEDNPFLWQHMREYVELTAELFDGLRLDNCHSTPLHVAEYLMDCARNVKPDLYVVAELFTNSDHVDDMYVNRLGITSLIREALSAWDSHEQGRLVHRFGGRAVGAFLRRGGPARPLTHHIAHALFMDLTHDNPSPIEKRSVFDVLPSAALVAMACCASGSTRGLDDLVPHHIHVVEEERLYTEWGGSGAAEEGRLGARAGLLPARRLLNKLHADLARGGYDEVYVDQMDPDIVAVTRHDPVSRQSVILVAVTSFRPPGAGHAWRAPPPLRFEGELHEIVLEATLLHTDHRNGGDGCKSPGAFSRDPRYITGLSQYECAAEAGVPLERSRVFAGLARRGGLTELAFRPVPPGTVVAVRVRPAPATGAALARVQARLADLERGRDALQLRPALADLDLADLNAALFRCDAEERGAGGAGVYDVPGHGPLPYAGTQGVASLLERVARDDDLGHPLCANLRAGDWLPAFLAARLEREPRLARLGARLRAAFEPLAELPRFLQPAYFEALFSAVHRETRAAALARLAPWCGAGAFSRALALTSVQLTARVPSAPLPAPAAPRAPSLSAGLPHFTTGYMRCWGRDTFISLPGLLLLPGRAQDARNHILGFAACLRHGLIPNLLDGGAKARFNCRDAVWWWLDGVRRYCGEVAGGAAILTEPVPRLFPRDEPTPAAAPAVMPLADVMQEALEAHFQGRAFREHNAGRALDAHMSDRGFDVQVGVHPDTGFPFGGNDANCGTWMDKMGSSERAGNRGRPATPRDGSAVELVALCYACVAWLADAHRGGTYPHAGVRRAHADGGATAWTWAQWAERVRRSFERHFWVPERASAGDARPDLVHRRAIYKDSHGASQPWADYQLRCNFPVAMAVAPALFDARHAWLALDQLERHLLAPLGLKTLDPADWAYRPDYDNSNDSDDPSVAHGFNYHQGPEWCWPLGFYLRARLAFARQNGQHARTVAAVLRALGPLAAHIESDPWRGLPELTNAGGRECPGSCRSQAWSSAAALEVLHDLRAATKTTALD